MLLSIVTNPEISTNDLNHDLDVIHQWVHQWKLEFKPDPTKQATEVLFPCKTSNPKHPQIMFNGTVVAIMNEQNHLGLLRLPILKTISLDTVDLCTVKIILIPFMK